MSQSTLSRGLGRDFSVHDLADRIRSEEDGAKWFVRFEGIGNLEDARFSAVAVRFGSFQFFGEPANLRCSRKYLPSRALDFGAINDC